MTAGELMDFLSQYDEDTPIYTTHDNRYTYGASARICSAWSILTEARTIRRMSDVINFEKMERGSWYTITGCGGNLNDWKDGYQNLLNHENIGTIRQWVEFTGADMNAYYRLSSDNAYPNDLHFLAFPLDGLDVSKLAIFKLRMGDRWFDDIVSNNTWRELVAAGMEG